MINKRNERPELLLDEISRGAVSRRDLVSMIGAAGVAGMLGPFAADLAFAARELQAANRAALRGSYVPEGTQRQPYACWRA